MTVQSTWDNAIFNSSKIPTQIRLYSIPSLLLFHFFHFLSSFWLSLLLLPFCSPSFFFLSFLFPLSFLAPSQKHIILPINLSARLDSLNMSSPGQSMQKMEVTLLVGNSGIGNPRNLRRRSPRKPRRPRGNNVRTIAPNRLPE